MISRGWLKWRESEGVDIPQVKLLNGVTVLSRKESTLLIADSLSGGVFRVKTRSKEVRLVIEDPLFDISYATASASGINGLELDRRNHNHNGSKAGDELLCLYFSNTN